VGWGRKARDYCKFRTFQLLKLIPKQSDLKRSRVLDVFTPADIHSKEDTVSETQVIYRCTPRQVREYSIDALRVGLVPMITGSPGIGKSALMRWIADQFDLELIDYRASTGEPTDIPGLPNFDKNGNAYFAPFRHIFPLKGMKVPEGKRGWLLFLDEVNSAERRMQAALYKVVLNRMCGQYELHEDVYIAMAGNLMTDKAIVIPLSTAMESRVIQLEMEVDFDDWEKDVAIPQDYDHRIIAFLREEKDFLMDFRPDKEDKSFCCPR
jgi:hypothetical protein